MSNFVNEKSAKVLLLVQMLLVATNSVFFKLSTLPAMTFVSCRFFTCALFFFVFMAVRAAISKEKMIKATLKEFVPLFFIGFSFAFGAFVYFIALKETSLPNVLILNSCNALFVVLLSLIILREKIGYKIWIATLVAFSGVVVIVLSSSATGGENSLWGDCCALMCALCAAIYMIFMKKYSYMDVPSKLFSVYVGSFVFATIVTFVQGNPFILTGGYAPREFLWFSICAVFSVCIPQIVLNLGLRHVKATYAGNVTLLDPVLGMVYGYFIFNQGLTLPQVIGGLLVITGLFYYNKVENG